MVDENRDGTAAQRTSRAANERFHMILVDAAVREQLIPFLCECAEPDCLGRVEMTLADYGEIHVDREVFVIMRGHRIVDGERAIDTRAEFDVFKKEGETG
jgi:hypothetical protein